MPIKPIQIKEWNDDTHIFVIPFKFKNTIYALDKYIKSGSNDQVEIFILDPKRVPLKLKRSMNWYNLALSMARDNFTVTQENARDVVQSLICDNEIIIDWTSGYIYYKQGNKMKRDEIKEYKLIEKPHFFSPEEEVYDFETNVL